MPLHEIHARSDVLPAVQDVGVTGSGGSTRQKKSLPSRQRTPVRNLSMLLPHQTPDGMVTFPSLKKMETQGRAQNACMQQPERRGRETAVSEKQGSAS